MRCSEEDIFNGRSGEKITDKHCNQYGHMDGCGYVSADYPKAKDFLQEMIFKFKLPTKPVPKIDLQEWNDMRKLMEKLKQSAMKSTAGDFFIKKKQLSRQRDFQRKSAEIIEGKIEQEEKQENVFSMDMEQTETGRITDVQSLQRRIRKSEKLVRGI